MRFPKCPKPPKWYWRLPIRWRQLYCRWFVWKWDAVHSVCTRILTREWFRDHFMEALSFSWYLLREDLAERLRRSGRNPTWSDIIGLQRSYWSLCWRNWRSGC